MDFNMVDRERMIEEHINHFNKIDRDVTDIYDILSKNRERTTKIEGEIIRQNDKVENAIDNCKTEMKNLKDRVNNVEGQTEAIIKLSISVEHVVKQNEEILQVLREHDNRLDTIENAPANLSLKLLIYLLGLGITFIIGKFM